MAVKYCNVCKGDMVPGADICGDLLCMSNRGKKLSAYQLMEKFIFDGNPPDAIAQEYNNAGRIKIVFRWKCGQKAFLNYNIKDYILTLARYMDFWADTLPGTEIMTTERKGGKSGGAGNETSI